MQHKKEDQRSDEKQDQGLQFSLERSLVKREALRYSSKVSVQTSPSTVKVARMGMGDGVLPLPMVVGREAKHSVMKPQTHCFARSKEGILGAVVKNNEDANQQPARQDGQRNSQPIEIAEVRYIMPHRRR